jgi:cell surface protein SprA
MIGIRNPIKLNDPNDPGSPRSAIIWVNELRLTNFNKSTGWATTGRVTMNLADLGNLSVSGTYKSAWFASLDQKITEIDLNAQSSFDIATNLELGKFFPEKAGVRIPMHFDYGEMRINPTFNPLDPDLKLNEVLDSYDLKEQQDSIKKMTVDYTQRKNINFMNVRKDKVGAQKKSHIYDIENFDVSYSYSELYHRNTDIEYDLNQNYMGGLGYNFNTNPKNVRPFEKIGFISKSKALLLIKDFNFYFMPKMFSFRTDMNRMYSTRKLRDKSFGDVKTFATYNKTWDWNRRYDLKFDLAKSLTFSFNANSQSFIKEYPGSNKEYWEGELDDEYVEIMPEEKQKLVSNELKSGGTKKNYTQNATINYNIPINKFPMLDWVNAQASYTVTYNWAASPIQFQQELGNQVANNVNISLNGNADFNKLYNKSKFLKDINKPPRNKKQGKKNNKNKGKKNSADSTQTKPKVNYGKIVYETFFKILMSVKKVTGQYSTNDGTNLPGFMPKPGAMGNNWGMDAPGMAFIFGAQPDGPDYFNQEGWLSQSTKLNTAYGKNHNESFNMRATLEPFKDFKVDITVDRTFSNNIQTYYVFDTVSNSFIENSWMQGGSFSMSFFSWRTAFGGDLPDEGSEYFNNFLSNRSTVANRVSEEDPRSIPVNDTTGYPEGYGANSQYVLIPSFLAAYGGKSPDAVDLNPFPKIPLPNWRISYNGLSRIPALKKIFKSVTLNHAYRSNYAAGSYNTNINFLGDTINGSVYPMKINPNNGDFYPEVEFGIISITEQFVPLINVDMQLQNSLLAKVEFKKARNISLSFANNQLTEVKSSEVTVGIGYRFKDLPITFASFSGNSKRTMKSDLNLKLDFSIRENKTVLRNINSNLNQISAGQKVVSINFSSDYMLSQSLTIRFYFDKIINNPFLPSQYRNSTTKGGITLRFSLAQ